jgi:hypothetical protein
MTTAQLLLSVAALWGGVLLVALLILDWRWRPIIRAYWEARCREAGTPMHVEDSGPQPGQLYPPTPPRE